MNSKLRTFNYERGPVLMPVILLGFPMDFPYFDANAIDYEPESKMTDGEKVPKYLNQSFQKCMVHEKEIDGKKQSALKIVLEDKDSLDKQKQKVKSTTTQIWVKGMPWWVQARYENKSIKPSWVNARLVSVNGKEVKIEPEDLAEKPQDQGK